MRKYRYFIQRNIKPIIGYSLFSLATFIIFLYILLPREAITARIIYEIESGTNTKIESTSSKWLFPIGLAFTGMDVTRTEGRAGDTLVHIERIAIAIPLKSIISLKPVSTINADIYGGVVNGQTTLRRDDISLQAKLSNIDISLIEMLKDIPAELSGRINGDIMLRLAGDMPDGQVRLSVKGGNIGKIRVMGFPLPDMPIEEFQGIIDIKGGVLSLKDTRFKNDDIKGSVKGDITFDPVTGQGDMNISIRFAVGERMKGQYQGILSFIERSRDKEGYYTIQIKGDMKKPSVKI